MNCTERERAHGSLRPDQGWALLCRHGIDCSVSHTLGCLVQEEREMPHHSLLYLLQCLCRSRQASNCSFVSCVVKPLSSHLFENSFNCTISCTVLTFIDAFAPACYFEACRCSPPGMWCNAFLLAEITGGVMKSFAWIILCLRMQVQFVQEY